MTTSVVLITGALTGIGRATTLAFAKRARTSLSLADANTKVRSSSLNSANSALRPNSYAPTYVTRPKYELWLTRPSRVLVAWMWPSIAPVPKVLPVR
jgi:NAD(P)-dependent dehydrogenase (short-subunit alcohol dehydrogenase family)